MYPTRKSLSLALVFTLLLSPLPVWSPAAAGELPPVVRATIHSDAACPPAWQIMTTPSEPGNNRLLGLSARTPDDVWAVGYATQTPTGTTLLEHYNGTDWSLMPTPSPLVTQVNWLKDVVALSATDAWAVGQTYTPSTEESRALLEHYNGAQWSVVAAPAIGGDSSWLNSIAAVGASDIWAVGGYQVGSDVHTLTMHYGGGDWTVVPSPDPGPSYNGLEAVFATPAGDIWAAGSQGTLTLLQTLILHYNGTSWDVAPTPNLGTADNRLRSITFGDATHAWAVGMWEDGAEDKALVLSYNGTDWTAASPSTGLTGDIDVTLWGVDAVSPTAVWAVGVLRGYGAYYRVVFGWDGTEWRYYPTGGDNAGAFYAVAHDPAGNLYAAGYLGSTNFQTLVEKAPPGCDLPNKLYLPAALLQAGTR